MIYLYLKTHNITGLKYLGKTEKDPFKYKGSGKWWLSHLKKYGNNVTTKILLATDDFNDLKNTGIFFSNLWNIVSSAEWANLMKEEGCGGDNSGNLDYISIANKTRITRSNPEWIKNVLEPIKILISNSERNTKQSDEWKNTVGKKVSDEATRRQNDPIWKETTGVIISEKAKKRWANKEYKNKLRNSISATQNCPEWKEKNYKKCEFCGNTFSPANYSQHHGDKCSFNMNRIQKEIIECPHCGKNGIISQMKRWHLDNCKYYKS